MSTWMQSLAYLVAQNQAVGAAHLAKLCELGTINLVRGRTLSSTEVGEGLENCLKLCLHKVLKCWVGLFCAVTALRGTEAIQSI